MKTMIKTEPLMPIFPQIKNEEPLPIISMGSPHESLVAPNSPTISSAGQKAKSPTRKKSTSSNAEEEDISNVPSLQMRIQILQQRVRGLHISLSKSNSQTCNT